MPVPKMKAKGKYTVHDYMTWPDEERWEIIDGVVYDMSPSPGSAHQSVSRNLTLFLGAALKGNTCSLWYAPMDVVLSETDVVQPDVFIVCEPNKITDKYINGAPDLIIEILSPSTSTKDQREKFHLYERYAVREYLIVDPSAMYFQRFMLEDDGTFGRGEIFDPQQTLPLKSLEDIEIPLWEIFEVEKIQEEASKESE